MIHLLSEAASPAKHGAVGFYLFNKQKKHVE
jgi:hypothetical protein